MSEEKKKRKRNCDTPSYSLKLRLLTSEEDEKVLDKRFRIATHIQNVMAKEARRRLNNLFRDRDYKELIFNIRKNGKWTKDEKKALQAFYTKYGLSEYSFHEYVDAEQKQFSKNIDSSTRQKEATKVWKSVQKFLFSNGKAVHAKSHWCKFSIEGKSNAAGIRYRDGLVEWKGLNIPVRIRKRDHYAKVCLKSGKIKYCRIKRSWHNHRWRYYVELVMEGLPPMKERKMGKGRVGIDIGTSTIAAVSEADMVFKELNDGIESIDAEIRRLSRKLDRQRRANNPGNYNANGTIKRDSKTFHKVWKKSKRQRVTEDKIRECYAKRSAKLSQFQDDLANEIVSMGDEIVIETMNFQALQKRAKKTEKSDKTGKYKKKKRFGKSISIHAPSSLIRKIKTRLAYHKGNLVEVDAYRMKASQMNHITGEYMSSDLNNRWKELVPGTLVQRDLYSAFLLFNAKNKEEIDFDLCKQTFDNFFDGHNRLIIELRKQKKEGKSFPSCMGI